MATGTKLLGSKYQDQAGGPGVWVVCCLLGELFLLTSALGAKFRSQCALPTAQKLGPLLKVTKPCRGSLVGGTHRGSRDRVSAASCCSSELPSRWQLTGGFTAWRPCRVARPRAGAWRGRGARRSRGSRGPWSAAGAGPPGS